MKKSKVIATLALGTLLAGCASDEIVNEQKLEELNGDGRISFVKKNTNMTRATTVAQKAGHYEFGVWAYKGAAANTQYADGDIMTKYLVAYGDNTTGNVNYKTLSAKATTYAPTSQDDHGSDPATVPGDGVSTWFYEGLGSTKDAHKTQTSPAAEVLPASAEQSLKYWDKSKAYHNYFAYMPYFSVVTSPTQDVELGTGANPNMTFTGIKAFYTDPVVDAALPGTNKEVQTGNLDWAGTYANPTTRDFYNTEIINANEANYAANAVAKTDYEKDVPLTFKHLNAKIKVAIWEAVPGYKVELIDLVNTTAVTANSSINGGNTYPGVAFTPATKAQAIEHNNAAEATVVTSTLPLPWYPTQAKVTAAAVQASAGVTARSVASYETTGETNSNANLRFTTESDDAIAYAFRETTPGAKSHNRISEVGGSSATVLNTTYYALPNVDQAAATTRITNVHTAAEQYSTSEKVGFNTGYTFHVSYRLLPEDGSAPTEVYDARVWVAPEYCYWADGKQYTYIFKITTNSNGTTDPNSKSDDIFGDSDNDPYIDPTDPRVPEDPALVPIVFDGIVVADYEAVSPFKDDIDPDDDTWQISNVESWPNIGTTTPYKFRYCNYVMTPEVYAGALDLSNQYYKTIGSPTAPATSEFTFAGATGNKDTQYRFTYTKDGETALFKATGTGTPKDIAYSALTASTWTTGVKAFHDGTTDIDATAQSQLTGKSGNQSFTTYTMCVWGKNDATVAWQYLAEPTDAASINIVPTLTKETVTTTYNTSAYKKVDTYLNTTVIAESKYYKANGSGWDEISKSAFDAITGKTADSPADYKYDFTYEFTVKSNGYSVTTKTDLSSPNLPSHAYAIVERK